MGVVHAKGLDMEHDRPQSSGLVDETLLLNLQARVYKVHVDGLGRTKDDIVIASVKELFSAKDFTEVLLKVHEVRNRLTSLSIFKNVGVLIDTCGDADCGPDGLEVTFQVQEQRRVSGGVSTLVGNNEGSLVLGLRLPNVAGRAEKLQAEYAHGTRGSSGFNVNLFKPFVHPTNPLLMSAIFQQNADLPYSGFSETDRGLFVELGFESAPKVQHQLRWEGVWRELKLAPTSRSFSVREEMGHCLKSSIKHTLQVDHRDCRVFPTKGILLRLQQELAGLGGDIGFMKNEAELQTNLRLPFDCVLQGSVSGAIIQSRGHGKSYNISDRVFLGGPLTLRGFEPRGAGPHDQGCAIGSDMIWTSALHLYTPLPFRPIRGQLGDRFRLHYFVNAGNIGSFHLDDSGDYQRLISSLWEKGRWSLGAGLVVQIGDVARVEVNYCVPMSVQRDDRICHGLQAGVGVSYL